MATIGQVIPEGTFQAFHEQEIRPITLESYRGRWVYAPRGGVRRSGGRGR